MEITIDMIRKAAEGSNKLQQELEDKLIDLLHFNQPDPETKTDTNPYGFFWGF